MAFSLLTITGSRFGAVWVFASPTRRRVTFNQARVTVHGEVVPGLGFPRWPTDCQAPVGISVAQPEQSPAFSRGRVATAPLADPQQLAAVDLQGQLRPDRVAAGAARESDPQPVAAVIHGVA